MTLERYLLAEWSWKTENNLKMACKPTWYSRLLGPTWYLPEVRGWYFAYTSGVKDAHWSLWICILHTNYAWPVRCKTGDRDVFLVGKCCCRHIEEVHSVWIPQNLLHSWLSVFLSGCFQVMKGPVGDCLQDTNGNIWTDLCVVKDSNSSCTSLWQMVGNALTEKLSVWFG